MSEQNVRAVRGLYDAFNRGDLDSVARGLSRSFSWNEAENSLYADGNPYRSFAAVRDNVFGPTVRDFDHFRCDVERLIDGGDYVIAAGRYSGRCKATGQSLSSQFCHVMHCDVAGDIDSLQEYTDTLQQAQVTGRVPVTQEMRIPYPAM